MTKLEQYKDGIESTTAQEKLLIHQIKEKQELLKNAIPYNANDLASRYKESLQQGKEPNVFNEGDILKINADIEKLQNKLFKLQSSKTKIQIDTSDLEKTKNTFNPDDTSNIKFDFGGKSLARNITGISQQIVKYKSELGALGDAYDRVREKQEKFENSQTKSNSSYQQYDTNAIQSYMNQYAQIISSKTQNAKEQIKSLNNQFQELKGTGQIKLDLDSNEAQNKIGIFKNAIKSLSPELANISTQILKIVQDASKMGDTIGDALSSGSSGNSMQLTADLVSLVANLVIQKIEQIKQEIEETKQKIRKIFDFIESKVKTVAKKILQWINPFKNIQKSTQKIGNNVENIGKGLKTGLKDVIKYAGALFSLRSIYTTLRSCANSWLSSSNYTAQQLSANIDYMKYALGSAFAPLMEYLVSLAYQLMKMVQSIIYSLFKVNIFANASAGSYSKMANSATKATKAMKQLSNVHSEIYNVSDNKEQGSGGSSTVSPNFDLSKVDVNSSLIDAIKNGNWYEIGQTLSKKIQDVLDSINWTSIQAKAGKIATNIANFLNGAIEQKDIGATIGTTLAEGINTALIFLDEFLTTFHFDSLGKTIGDGINGFFLEIEWETLGRDVANGVNGLVKTIGNAIDTIKWTDIASNLAKGLNNAVKTIKWDEAGQTVSKWVVSWFKSINTFLEDTDWEEIGKSIKTFILNIDWQKIWEALKELWGTFKDSLKDLLTGMFGEEKAEKIMDTIEAIGVALVALKLNDILDEIKEWAKPVLVLVNLVIAIKNVIEKLKELKENWGQIPQWFTDKVANLKAEIKQKWSDLKTKWTNLTSNIKEKKVQMKAEVTQKWSDLKTKWQNLIKNFKDQTVNVKVQISAIIDNIKSWLNKSFIDKVNKVIPSWMGQIPRLAKGGVLTETTLVMAGEYPGANRNPEIVTPQNIMYETILKALSNSDFGNNNDKPIYLTINVGNKKLGQILIDDLRDTKRRTGKDIEAIVGG